MASNCGTKRGQHNQNARNSGVEGRIGTPVKPGGSLGGSKRRKETDRVVGHQTNSSVRDSGTRRSNGTRYARCGKGTRRRRDAMRRRGWLTLGQLTTVASTLIITNGERKSVTRQFTEQQKRNTKPNYLSSVDLVRQNVRKPTKCIIETTVLVISKLQYRTRIHHKINQYFAESFSVLTVLEKLNNFRRTRGCLSR